jgi:hypothetical protein
MRQVLESLLSGDPPRKARPEQCRTRLVDLAAQEGRVADPVSATLWYRCVL